MSKQRRTKGEGSVFQKHDHPTCPPETDGTRPDHRCQGTWVGRVDLGIIVKGRVRRQVTAKTRRELTPKLEALKREVATGVVGTDSTTAAWLTYWLDNIAVHKVRERTLVGYRSYVTKWIEPTIGHVRLDKLRPDHVRAMHKHMRDAGKSEATVRQAHAILHRALEVAEKERKIMRNPAGDVDPPKVSTKHHAALELHHCRTLLAWAPDVRTRARLACAILMGLRQGEALGLRWDDVDFDAGTVYVHQAAVRLPGEGVQIRGVKSAASVRWVPMVGSVLDTMREWQAVSGGRGFVFGSDDTAADPRRDWQDWKDACEAAGVPAVPLHGARASCASILDALGFSPRLVADILGHAQVMVTQKHYARSYGDQRRAALESMTQAIEKGADDE